MEPRAKWIYSIYTAYRYTAYSVVKLNYINEGLMEQIEYMEVI